MVVVLFRSRLRPDVGAEYEETAEHMLALVRAMPGFVSFKTYTAPDGERMSIGHFDSDEALGVWRHHPEHVEAQRRGREAFYAVYDIEVAEVKRAYGFQRDAD